MLSHIIYLAVTYALVFTGFFSSNGFLTLLYQSSAFISFSLYYGTYCVSCLFAPFVISRLNIRWCIVVSAFMYVMYIGFVSSKMTSLLLVGACLAGPFHSIMWISQGILIARFPDDVRSSYIGTFFGILNSSIIFGNLLSLIVLVTGLTTQQMLWILLSITFVGAVMSIFIMPFSCSELCSLRSIDNGHHVNILDSIKRVFTTVGIHRGYLLIPIMILQTFDVNVSIQILSRLLIVNAHGDKSVGIYTAAMYLVYGCSAFVSSMFIGRLFDKLGWKVVFSLYAFFQVISITGIMLLSKLSSSGPMGLWMTVSFVKGMSDNITIVITNISITNTYKETTDLMMAFYRFTFGIFYVISSVMVGYVSYEWILLIDGVFVVVSIVSYSFFHVADIGEQFEKSGVVISRLVL